MDQKVVLPNSRSLLREAWGIYKRHNRTILAIQVLPLVLVVLGVALDPVSAVLAGIFSFVGSITTAFAVLTLIIFIGRYSTTAEPIPTVRNLYRSSWGLILPFIWVGILNAFVMTGAVILLVVPAFYLAIAVGFNAFIVVLENQRGLRSLATSWAYVSGSWWRVFWRQIVLFAVIGLVYLLLFSAARLGGEMVSNVVGQVFIVLVLTPISLIYSFLLYGYLKQGARAKMDEAALEARGIHYRKWLKFFAILGLLLILLIPIVGMWGIVNIFNQVGGSIQSIFP